MDLLRKLDEEHASMFKNILECTADCKSSHVKKNCTAYDKLFPLIMYDLPRDLRHIGIEEDDDILEIIGLSKNIYRRKMATLISEYGKTYIPYEYNIFSILFSWGEWDNTCLRKLRSVEDMTCPTQAREYIKKMCLIHIEILTNLVRFMRTCCKRSFNPNDRKRMANLAGLNIMIYLHSVPEFGGMSISEIERYKFLHNRISGSPLNIYPRSYPIWEQHVCDNSCDNPIFQCDSSCPNTSIYGHNPLKCNLLIPDIPIKPKKQYFLGCCEKHSSLR